MTLKKQIFDLKSKGYSFQQIARELKCSKSTVSYHLSPNQKDLTLERLKKQKELNNLLIRLRSIELKWSFNRK